MNRTFTRVALRLGLAIGAAIMLFPSQTPASSASGIDLNALLGKALANARSFKVVSDSTTSTAPKSPRGVMKMHSERIYVRRGTGFAMSVYTTTDSQLSAMVFTGTHVCIKRTASAPWDCSVPASVVKAYVTNMDPLKAFKEAGVVMNSVSSAGTKTVQGQPCSGYNYVASLQSIHYKGHGTVWFSLATGRLVMVDGVGTAALVAGSPLMVLSSTAIYSRWNDPSLNIPAVPAS